ncbi:MAG: ABC transporter substrate-binding protein [Chloroflexi bacterium]|nr:ABC transporter substrate-binding protein [Chloroflexota bacterium]
MVRKLFYLCLLGLVILPLAQTAAQEDTIRVRNIGNVSTFNDLFITDGASNSAAGLVWPMPINVDRFSGLPIPGLTSWEISDDSLTYTFTIRDDANWSDGVPITSADAKFVYEAAVNPDVGSTIGSRFQNFAQVNIIDEKTYEVVLKSADCSIFTSFNSLRFLPSHLYAADFSDIQSNENNQFPTVSGGPYILEEIEPGSFQRFRANPTYWAGEPNIENWVYLVIEDPALLVQALAGGEVDYSNVDASQKVELDFHDHLTIHAFPVNSVGLFIMNWVDETQPVAAYDENGNLIEQEPHRLFGDVRVRQAVAMGYSKDDVIATLGEDGGTRLSSSVVPAIEWAYNADIEPWPYDPEAAMALLEEAGWVDEDGDGVREKDGVRASFTISYSPLINYFETTALVAQDQLSQIGFEVSVENLEWATYLNDVLLAQKFDASVVSWGGGSPPDPTSTEDIMRSTNDVPGAFNVASYVNPHMDDLFTQGRTVSGCAPEDRVPIYNEVQQIQHDELPYEFTLSPTAFHVVNNRVGNFNPGPWWIVYDAAHEYTFGE